MPVSYVSHQHFYNTCRITLRLLAWDQHVRDHCSDCVSVFVNVIFLNMMSGYFPAVATEPGTSRLIMMFSKLQPRGFCFFFNLNWQLKLKKRKHSTHLWFVETYDEFFSVSLCCSWTRYQPQYPQNILQLTHVNLTCF